MDYIKGKPIKDLNELLEQKEMVYLNDKPLPMGFVKSMHLNTIVDRIERNEFFTAEPLDGKGKPIINKANKKYKYIYDIVAINYNDPWNKTVKITNEMFRENHDLFRRIGLEHDIETNIEPTKESIEQINKLFKDTVYKAFKEQNIVIESYKFNHCEVVIEE